MSLKFTYRVFEEDTKNKLEVKIETHLEVGYALVGGVSASNEVISQYAHGYASKTYLQAMVLYHE